MDSQPGGKRDGADNGTGEGDGKQNPNQRAKPEDPLIGLQTTDKVFYCRRSILANMTGSYFGACFGPNFADDFVYKDANGIKIYSVDADGDTFAWIMKYITKGRLNLPDFYTNKVLWRDLRDHAVIFALDGLAEQLYVTHTCSIDTSSSAGVFYWLGTNKGTAPYQNPAWFEVPKVALGFMSHANPGLFEEKNRHLKSVFEYCAPTLLKEQDLQGLAQLPNTALKPVGGEFPLTTTIDMRNTHVLIALRDQITLQPTHVSFRSLNNIPFIHLEASNDWVSWDFLRLEREPPQVPDLQVVLGDLRNKLDFVKSTNKEDSWYSESIKTATDVAERYFRKTWKVEHTDNFYKWFRFAGAEPGSLPPDEYLVHCLEFFGNVHED